MIATKIKCGGLNEAAHRNKKDEWWCHRKKREVNDESTKQQQLQYIIVFGYEMIIKRKMHVHCTVM